MKLTFLAILISIMQTKAQKEDFLIMGHRGAGGHVMENTLPSIRKAIELGVNAIEIDVFKCASGELVVFHDQSLKRLTGVKAKIESLQLDSLRKIRIDNEYGIPTLEEVIAEINGKVMLNIELKGMNTAKETRRIIDSVLVKGEWKEEQFVVSSFKHKELQEYRDLSENAGIVVLTFLNPLRAIKFAQQVKALGISPRHGTLNKRRIKKIQEKGFKVIPWTVNDPKDIEAMLELGVDGLITDYPDRVLLD